MTELLFVLSIIVSVLSTVLSLPFFWNILVGAVGGIRNKLIKNKDKSQDNEKARMLTFAVIICARNESEVIGGLLKSLNEQTYPRELFDIYVIADNCSDDKTALAAERGGATVLEREDRAHVGKGYALRWGFDKIFTLCPDKYDAVCVFDADNLASADFLQKMNDALNKGADGAQGMRRASNPYESVLSGCYEIYFRCINVFQNISRASLGLSCFFGGTGFALRSEYVRNGGWDTVTVSEDTEFSLRLRAKGGRIAAVRDAVFYDEQPTEWKVSMTQRLRWMFGGKQCAAMLLKKSTRERIIEPRMTLAAVDSLMFLLAFPAMAIVPIDLFLSLLTPLIWGDPMGAVMILVHTFLWNYCLFFVLSLLAVLPERRGGGRLMGACFVFPVFMLLAVFLSFKCLFIKDLQWKPIRHKHTLDIESAAKL